MNSTGVLDDYLDELLGEAIAPAVVLPTPDSVAPAPASISQPDHEPTWDDLPAEVIYETDTVAAAPAADNAALEAAFEAAATAGREPTWDDLPAEVIYETETVAVAPAEDDAALEAAFEAAAMPVAAPEREPTWDDLPDEVIHETAPAKADPEPTWDDLPDEVIYETDAADSHHLAHTDSPGLQAAFEAASGGADVPTPPPAVVAPPAPRPAP
ncbi:chemotaxis protein CheW, partial [Stenotrophomonas maltophilia]